MSARRRAGLAAVVLLVAGTATALRGQGAPALEKVLYDAADAIGMLREVDEEDGIARVDFWATGTMAVGGQTYRLAKYRVSINYDDPGIRVDFTRVGPDGKELPREIQVAAKGFAWNEKTPGVGAVPVPGAADERLLWLWTPPPGLIKAAHAAGAKASVAVDGGKPVLSFPIGSAVVRATLGAGNFFERVEMRTGGTVTVTTFAEFGELNDADYKADVFWPRRIVQTRGGATVLDLTLTRTNTYNPYVIVPVPANVRNAGATGRPANQ